MEDRLSKLEAMMIQLATTVQALASPPTALAAAVVSEKPRHPEAGKVTTTEEEPAVCEDCGDSFPTLKGLKLHKRMHCKGKPRPADKPPEERVSLSGKVVKDAQPVVKNTEIPRPNRKGGVENRWSVAVAAAACSEINAEIMKRSTYERARMAIAMIWTLTGFDKVTKEAGQQGELLAIMINGTYRGIGSTKEYGRGQNRDSYPALPRTAEGMIRWLESATPAAIDKASDYLEKRGDFNKAKSKVADVCVSDLEWALRYGTMCQREEPVAREVNERSAEKQRDGFSLRG